MPMYYDNLLYDCKCTCVLEQCFHYVAHECSSSSTAIQGPQASPCLRQGSTRDHQKTMYSWNKWVIYVYILSTLYLYCLRVSTLYRHLYMRGFWPCTNSFVSMQFQGTFWKFLPRWLSRATVSWQWAVRPCTYHGTRLSVSNGNTHTHTWCYGYDANVYFQWCGWMWFDVCWTDSDAEQTKARDLSSHTDTAQGQHKASDGYRWERERERERDRQTNRKRKSETMREWVTLLFLV